MFNVNRRNNQFLYDRSVIEGEAIRELALPIGEPLSSNKNINTGSNIKSVLNYNYKGIPLLYSIIRPRAYELTDIAELIKEETDCNVMLERDQNTMKCLMEIKQGAISFDVENSRASLLGFRKIVYKKVNMHPKRLLI